MSNLLNLEELQHSGLTLPTISALQEASNIAATQTVVDVSLLAPTDGLFIVGDGDNLVGEAGAVARASMGVAIGIDVQAWTAVLDGTTASYTSAEETKLAGIETGADITDSANVLSALSGQAASVGSLLVTSPGAPSSASDTGTAGTIAWDTSYMYVCIATDTWKRAAISTW